MGSIYRVGVELYGTAAQAVGAINQTLTATTRLGQGFRTAASQSSVLNSQTRALATTFRYALAGSVIFGITGALSKLAQFENQLGTLNSLMGELNAQGKFQGVGSQLDDLGSEAIVLSNRFGAAVTDVESYMTRFASTFSRGKLDVADYNRELTGFTSTILQLQAALGSEAGDPAALASGIGGLVNVIPGGKRNPAGTAKQVSDYMAYLTQVTPNVTGTDLANAAGRMASVYNTTGMTPQQIFAIFGQAFKAGGSPSIAIRGVQQLLGQSLLTPKSADAKAAFQRVVGTSDPNALRNYSYGGDRGAFAVFAKLMDTVTPPGGFRYSKQQLAKAGSATSKAQLQQALPGLDLTTLMSFFGRIQSVQQFVNILSQGGVKGLRDFVKGLDQANRANLTQQRANAALSRMGLTRLSTSVGNIMLSLVRPLNTPATAIEDKIVNPASNVLARHRTLTTVGESLVAGAVGARLLSGTALGRMLKLDKIPLLGKAGGIASAGVMAAEAANIAGGSTAPDGSMANPFWVILSPYSSKLNPMGGPGAPTSAPGDRGFLNKVGKKLTSRGAVAGETAVGTRLATVGVGTVAGAAGLAVAIPLTLGGDQGGNYMLPVGPKRDKLFNAYYDQIFRANPRHTKLPTNGRVHSIVARAAFGSQSLTYDEAEHLLHTRIGFRAFERTQPGMLGSVAAAINSAIRATNFHSTVTYQGTAKADLTLKLVDENGHIIIKTVKRGVPITKDSAPTRHGRTGGKP